MVDDVVYDLVPFDEPQSSQDGEVVYDLVPFDQEPEEQEGYLGDAVDNAVGSLLRGVDQLQATGYGLAAIGGDVVGSESISDWGIEGYERNQAEAAENKAAVGSYENIRTDSVGNFAGDFGQYAVEAVFENLPMFLPSLVTGGIGAAVARKGAEELVEKVVATKIKEGLSEVAAKKAAESMIKKRIAKGAMIGGFPAGGGLVAGEVYGDIYQETGQREAGVALAAGAVGGVLEALPGASLFKNLFGRVGKEASEHLVKRIGKTGATQFLLEGGTELLQTIVEKAAVNHVDPTKEIFSEKNVVEIIDSALKGGIGGGVIGGGLEVFNRPVGTRETARNNVELTQADHDSALADKDIKLGKESMAETAVTPQANDILARNNLPPLDTNITIDFGGELPSESGKIVDTSEAGFEIEDANGERAFKAFGTLNSAGATVSETVPDTTTEAAEVFDDQGASNIESVVEEVHPIDEFDDINVPLDDDSFGVDGEFVPESDVASPIVESDVQQEVAPVEDAESIFAASERMVEVEEAQAKEIAAEGDDGVVLAKDMNGRKAGAMVTRNSNDEGGWRITQFDEDGFFGHMVFPTKEAAVKEALSEGYQDTNRNLFNEIGTTDRFTKGNESLEAAQAANEAAIAPTSHSPAFGNKAQQLTILKNARKSLVKQFGEDRVVVKDGQLAVVDGTNEENIAAADEMQRQADISIRRGEAARKRGGPKRKGEDSLAGFLANRGGIIDRGGELKSMGFNDWNKENPGNGKLIRPPSDNQADIEGMVGNPDFDYQWEQALEAAIVEGYFPEIAHEDVNDMDAREIILDALDKEQRAVPNTEELVEDENQAFYEGQFENEEEQADFESQVAEIESLEKAQLQRYNDVVAISHKHLDPEEVAQWKEYVEGKPLTQEESERLQDESTKQEDRASGTPINTPEDAEASAVESESVSQPNEGNASEESSVDGEAQEGLTLHPSGKPFNTQQGAQRWGRKNGMPNGQVDQPYEAVEIAGGWALQPTDHSVGMFSDLEQVVPSKKYKGARDREKFDAQRSPESKVKQDAENAAFEDETLKVQTGHYRDRLQKRMDEMEAPDHPFVSLREGAERLAKEVDDINEQIASLHRGLESAEKDPAKYGLDSEFLNERKKVTNEEIEKWQKKLKSRESNLAKVKAALEIPAGKNSSAWSEYADEAHELAIEANRVEEYTVAGALVDMVSTVVMNETPPSLDFSKGKIAETRENGVTGYRVSVNENIRKEDEFWAKEHPEVFAKLKKEFPDLLGDVSVEVQPEAKVEKEDFRDQEIGDAIGADEREEGRDDERDQRELKARRAGKKVTDKKQKEADEGLFAAPKDEKTPLEQALEDDPNAPLDDDSLGTDVPAPTAPESSYGDDNKFITKDAMEEIRKKLKAKLSGNQLNSGFDPEIFALGAQAAAYHIEAGARTFIDFSKAMIADFGEDAQPYLKSWYNGARDFPYFNNTGMTPVTEIDNVSSTSERLESNSENANAENGVGEANVSARRPANESVVGRGDGQNSLDGAEQSSSNERTENDPASVGERGNSGLHGEESSTDTSTAERGERERSSEDSNDGLQDEREGSEDFGPSAKTKTDVDESVPKEIRDALPKLHPAQQRDVIFAEERFAQEDGHGVMFTNGTGTGKTWTGIGIAKRMVDAGKDNILILVPGSGVSDQWFEDGAENGLKLSKLKDTKDSGSGVVITTYANFRANHRLAGREWDLVIADESQNILEAKDGEEKGGLKYFRGITNHPKRLPQKARMLEFELLDEINVLEGKLNAAQEARKAFKSGNQDRIEKALKALKREFGSWDAGVSMQAATAQAEEMRQLISPLEVEMKRRVDARMPAVRELPRGKVVFLSATPFGYDKTVDYAEGYLFEYGAEPASRGYNDPDAQQSFMIQHFGYRMRTNKLTRPEAEVENDVMEVAFHENLRERKVLSGRVLEVDQDYDRKFVLIDDGIGNKIDELMEFLRDAEDGKFKELSKLVESKFDYLSRMRLLEAIKAHHAIDVIKEHHKLGRKVIVFHDYNVGGGINPFHLTPEEMSMQFGIGNETFKMRDLHKAFVEAKPEALQMDFSEMKSPIETLSEAFPNVDVYNGKKSDTHKANVKRRFNLDDNGINDAIDLVVVQAEAGKAGISLHDKSGKHQRVIINIGMPSRATTTIQQEGRIYRIGQATDAIFRYMNTGTNWERNTFANSIAARAGTAENLALGNQARSLRQSIINAFIDSDTYPASTEDGKGGKELDRASGEEFTEFQKAKTFYFAQQQQRGRRDQREGQDYFPTPEPVGLKMVEFADIKPGDDVLEPSVGHGAIARYFPNSANKTIIDNSNTLLSKARLAAAGAKERNENFEDLHISNKYDAIVMNPPYGSGSKTAIEHLEKASKHLRNGGRIVALIPEGGMATKRLDKFMESDAAKDLFLVADVSMPRVLFKRAGTGVKGHIIVLEKHTDQEVAQKLEQSNRDYSDAETIGDMFDQIEDTSVQSRLEPLTKEVEPVKAENGKVTAGGIEFKLSEDRGRFYDEYGKPYIAKAKGKLGGRFKPMAKLAESKDGQYLSRKGFIFKTEEDRQSFLDAVESGEAVEEVAADPNAPLEFTTEDTKHTKTGADIFVAKAKRRFDNYQHIKQLAQANGGKWSRFLQGFEFKTNDDRRGFLQDVGTAQSQDGVKYSLRSDFKEKLPRTIQALKARLKQLGLSDKIALRLEEKLTQIAEDGTKHTADGLYVNKLITLAMDAANPEWTLNHEVVHALKDLGVFRSLEWKTLEKAALADKERMAEIKKRYPDLTESEQLEEAIADMFADHVSGKTQTGGALKRAFDRAVQFIKALYRSIRKQGFNTAEEIFEGIDSGVVGRRQKGDGMNTDPRYHSAYHGSPHDHDGFSTDHVGEGEGKAAYGWGIYFADRKMVAEWYKKVLGKGKSAVIIDGVRIDAMDAGATSESAINAMLKDAPSITSIVDMDVRRVLQDSLSTYIYTDIVTGRHPKSSKKYADKFRESARQRRETPERERSDYLDYEKMALQQDKAADIVESMTITTGAPSRLYSVELAPKVEEYLDWDKPFNEQSQNVQNAIIELDEDMMQDMFDEYGMTYDIESMNGKQIYNAIKQAGVQDILPPLNEEYERSLGSKERASLYLKTFNVPGIRYLDGQSRKKGEGDRNYVIFDDKDISITAKASRRRPDSDQADLGQEYRGDETVEEAPRDNSPHQQETLLTPTFDGPSEDLAAHLEKSAEDKLSQLKAGFNFLSDAGRMKLQDKLIWLKRTEEAVVEARGEELGVDSTYDHEALMHGKIGKRIQDFQADIIEPLIEKVREFGISLEDVNKYLYARHAKERNDQINSIDENSDGAGSGWDNAHADSIMAGFSAEQLTKLKEVARDVDGIIQKSLQQRIDAGLLDKKAARQWLSTYKHYVPLRGFADETLGADHVESSRMKTGKGLGAKGEESKRALGRNSEAGNILAHVIMNAEETIIRSEKNEVGKVFFKMVQANPNDAFWEISKTEYTKGINQGTGLVEAKVDSRYALKDNVMTVKVDGKQYHIAIHHEGLARGLKDIGASDTGRLTRALQTFNRYLAFINTSANPEFMFGNFSRDIQTALLNLSEEETANLRGKVIKDMKNALRGAYGGIKGKRDTEWQKFYHEYAEAGGKTEFFGLEDAGQIEKHLNDTMAQLDPTKPMKVKKAAKKLFDFIQDANGAVENAVRLSAFVNARRAGASTHKAAVLAKNLTVNFNRKGEWSSQAGALYLFYNASIQGSVRILQAMKSKKVQKLVGGVVAASFALEMINSALSQEGDDGEDEWDKITEFTKAHNIIIMKPWAEKGDKTPYFKIPMPYGYNVFATLGRVMAEVATDKKGFMAGAGDLIATVSGSFNPIGAGHDFLSTVTPTFIQPFAEIGTNKNFMGSPIRPQQNQFGPEKPDSQLAFKSVSGQAKWIAETINNLTGGNKYEPGAIDFSPEVLDHVVAFLTGGAGTFVSRAANAPAKIVSGKSEWNDVPVVRRFLGSPNGYYTNAKYRKISVVMEQTIAARKHFTGKARLEHQKQRAPEIAVIGHFKNSKKILRRLYKARKRMKTESAIELQNKRIDKAMIRFNKSYHDAVKRLK